MFDFKKELAKFQPLPEMKDVEKIINDNNIEDLMDILREALKNKERLIMIDRHYNFNYSSGAGENGYLIKIYNLSIRYYNRGIVLAKRASILKLFTVSEKVSL